MEGPRGGSYLSFPSGHTSAAFTGAAFINFRYGFKYALPFYAASTFVAYNRVQERAHYVHDVLAGAALGIIGTYLFTTPYKDNNVMLFSDGKYAGIAYHKIFD